MADTPETEPDTPETKLVFTFRSEDPPELPKPGIQCYTSSGPITFSVKPPGPPSIYTDPIGWLYLEVSRLRERVEELERDKGKG